MIGLILMMAVLIGAMLAVALSKTPMTWHAAPSTGRTYWIKNAGNKDAVADRLAALEISLKKFVRDARVAYPDDPRLRALRRRWDGTLAEVERPGDIAYSMNKKTIYVCIRDSEGALQDFNTTMYVLLHEVAHVCTDAYGHPPVYWKNFRWVLEVADQLDYYTYQDFDAIPTTHCGHRLGNNAMACVRRSECPSTLTDR